MIFACNEYTFSIKLSGETSKKGVYQCLDIAQ